MQVNQAPGRADDHVHARFQRRNLVLVRAAAVNRGHAHRRLGGGVGEVVADLHGELAGGHNHQRARGAVELVDVGVVKHAV